MRSLAGHYFISYSSADAQEFAFRLYDGLTTEPYSFAVWLDKHDIKAGYAFDDQIKQGIGTCKALLFLMTKDSVDDLSICKDEWIQAFRYKKPVIPLLFHRDAEMPFLFGNRHYLDFTSDYHLGFQKLVDHLNWLSLPPGILQQTEYVLQDKMRELRRAADDTRRTLVEEEISDLRRECDRLREIVSNPAESERRVSESIARGIDRERQPEIAAKAARSKFINTPPREAPSYFQNRHVETALAGKFLSDNTKRVLTVVGRGGIGKTVIVCRLLKALEIGQLPDEGGRFEVDGIVYLSAIGSRRITALNLFTDLCKLLPDDVAGEMDELYKSPQLSTYSKIEALVERLDDRRIILLLDNFEDVIDVESRNVANAELAETLAAILKLDRHPIRVVITSRVVAADLSMMNPERQMRIDLDEGLDSPYAENILREMDSEGRAGLRDAPDKLLAEARERTRGFPRALEHLFAILINDRDTSLQEILDDTKKLLPEEVMEVLVGESFNRLDATTQMVMHALAIYARPVSAVAIDYMLQPFVVGIDSAPMLKRLVNMQLVRKQAGRYYLHPVDRAYASSRIPEGRETDRNVPVSPPFTQFALRNRGADYFRQIRTASAGWKTYEDLRPQFAEFDLRVAGQDYETAALILLEIDFGYLYVWGYFREMAEMHASLNDKIQDPAIKESSLGNQATALRVMGQSVAALNCYQQAMAIARKRESPIDEAVWLGNMGNCYQDMGQTRSAIECNEKALAIKEKRGSGHGRAHNLSNLGNCCADLGDSSRAIEYHERALDAARSQFDGHSEGLILSNLAEVLEHEGRFEEARDFSIQGLEIGEVLKSPMICAYNLLNLAAIGLFSGDLVSAFEAADKLRRYDLPEINHACLRLLGVIALRRGKTAIAREAFDETIVRAEAVLKTSPEYFQAWDAKGIALCGLALCDGVDNRAAAIDAYRHARKINSDPGIVSRALRLFGALVESDAAGILTEVKTSVTGTA